ncbi:MAG: sigma-70 family RNA polymerase sigma factor [Holophaga sp.]|jgi:RNA polymerase sigma factor (sigma-70 family)
MQEGQNRLLEIFQREKARFLAFVRGRIRGLSGLDPEDVVAEVFGSLLDRGDLVAEAENLAAYIYRSLGNRILDARRRPAPAPAAVDPDQLPDPVQDPHSAFQAAQLRERLGRALDALSPRERAVWLATELDGESFRALADRWGEPIGTLLARKSRAAAKLRHQLAGFNPSWS